MFKRLILLFSFVLLSHCSQTDNITSFERTMVMMDTFIQVNIYDQDKSEDILEKVMQKAFDKISAIDKITNIYSDSSLISKVNREAGKTKIEIDTVLFQLINSSADISILSDGAYDITVQSVEQLWNFMPDNYRIPGDELLADHLKWVDPNHIELDSHSVKFASPQVRIDLGGIAKGYAIDEAMRVLQEHGIRDALVNAGGDLRAVCSELTRGKRHIWIKHPRDREKLFGSFQMDDGCAATSGDYERYFVADSVRYHHILDPKTGYPANKCMSATVMAESAMMADALATAVFVLGPQEGMALIERLPNVEGVILFERNGDIDWKASLGLKDTFILK